MNYNGRYHTNIDCNAGTKSLSEAGTLTLLALRLRMVSLQVVRTQQHRKLTRLIPFSAKSTIILDI